MFLDFVPDVNTVSNPVVFITLFLVSGRHTKIRKTHNPCRAFIASNKYLKLENNRFLSWLNKYDKGLILFE